MGKFSIAIAVESLHTQGGVERRTFELAKGLLSAGHEVHIYANRWDPKVVEGAVFHRVPILKLGRAMKPVSFSWFCSTMIPKRHDLIHTQARILRYDLATLGVGCHKACLDAVGINPDTAPDRSFHRAVLRLERAMFAPEKFEAGTRIIVNSRMCKGELMRYYNVPEEHIHVVHNGVDQDAFSPENRMLLRAEARQKLNIPANDLVALFVGAGFHRKGLDTLIKAAGHFHLCSSPMANRIRLMIVGRGNREEYAGLAARMGMGDRLIWIGQSDSSDIASHYAAADIFVLPTRYDPFANSAMEALASGLPVVTTTTNGVSEIIRDGVDGFIVEPNDSEALSNRIQVLAEDADLRQHMGSNGRKAVEPHTWQRTTQHTMAVYDTIIARRSKS